MEIALFMIAVALLILIVLETLFIVYLNNIITKLRDEVKDLKREIRNVDNCWESSLSLEKNKTITHLAGKKGVMIG